jgi:hypothetical protein
LKDSSLCYGMKARNDKKQNEEDIFHKSLRNVQRKKMQTWPQAKCKISLLTI